MTDVIIDNIDEEKRRSQMFVCPRNAPTNIIGSYENKLPAIFHLGI